MGSRTAFEEALQQNAEATNSHYYAATCAFQLGLHDDAENHAAAYAATGANAFAEVVRNLPGDTRGQVGSIVSSSPIAPSRRAASTTAATSTTCLPTCSTRRMRGAKQPRPAVP